MIFDGLSVKRIILDLALKAGGKSFTGDAAYYEQQGICLKDDLGLDSIEMLTLVAYVNSFFNVFEVNDPPYLLSSTKVDDWVAMVLAVRKQSNNTLSFNTSGTSGDAKIVRHDLAYLDREVTLLASLFSYATCIIPYVPAYTIYGFLLTVGLPLALNIPVVYPSAVNWQQLPANALIVGTPFNWQWLADSLPGVQLNCLGVSAASAMSDGLYHQLEQKGVKLTELYGATETAGVAYRNGPLKAFTAFEYWQLLPDGSIKDKQSRQVFTLMDEIELLDDITFTLIGRKDKQVKVAGHLVNLDNVASSISQLPNVKQCTISAKATEKGTALIAAITLMEDNEERRDDVKAGIRQMLDAHEKPQHIYFS